MKNRILMMAAMAAVSGVISAQIVVQGEGANAAALQATVDNFRAGLGVLRPNNPGTFLTGRREINWDAVGAAFSSPNLLPGDFFNGPASPRARGAIFSTPGTGLLVSQNPDVGSDANTNFGNINAQYRNEFQRFSNNKLFAFEGSTTMDMTFRVPGGPTIATSRGFGVVFCDVDSDSVASIEMFDVANSSLGIFIARALDKGLSFIGAYFDTPIVSRVRITSGNTNIGVNDDPVNGSDIVVMDDFIYGEPVPEPASVTAFVTGILFVFARRKKRNS